MKFCNILETQVMTLIFYQLLSAGLINSLLLCVDDRPVGEVGILWEPEPCGD